MRWYDIALFLFILQLFGGLLANYAESMGIRAVLYVSQPTQEEMQEAQRIKQKTTLNETATVGGTDPVSRAFGWFYMQISNAVNYVFTNLPLVKYVFWIPLYLQAIGVPKSFAWAIFSVYTIIEVIGFVQLLTGREIER